ncbi:MAG: TlpA family protein disulfide reductase [Candidatus Scalindua sp.]|jgi:peroxiredoxin|nr:TlpA family protein disulfide reductase [Candidatus Scalindua sp.]MBT5304334.1 TlpA family protein disulfide reductase [Candidatus Scalindua sp.]MBT6227083.1 TlpA family protein disulfide reductase [Candidatus Scalindua sp.]MBT7213298.1 TlpA family protein disulfide reductase [Candidatus Scalindua sp.]MBT7589795.1 TlpA family protein disulfide reductase [Candidatus Scalindua sp.]
MNTVMRIFSVFLLSVCVILVLTFSTKVVFAGVETGVNIGQKAAPFKLSTVDGKELELGSFAKDNVTLLVFGTTWCPSCRHEVPILKEYYNDLKDNGLRVLGIDVQESKKKVSSFVEKNRINYPVVLDSNTDAARLYKVVGIPLNIILDKNGVIRYRETRPPDKEFLEKLLLN